MDPQNSNEPTSSAAGQAAPTGTQPAQSGQQPDAAAGTTTPEDAAAQALLDQWANDPDPDAGKGGKDAVLADLAGERKKRQAVEQQLADLRNSNEQQLDAIAKALGLKQDDPQDAAAIAKQLEDSQRQAADNAAALTRFQVAVEKAVPAHLVEFVTGSTRDEVEASVEKVLAAFNATPGQQPTGPRPDPSQGQQGAPASLDALITQATEAGDTREAIRLKARKGLTTTT